MKKLIVILGLVLVMCLLVIVSCAPGPAGPPESPVVPPTLPEPITVTPEEPSTTDVDVSDYPSYTTISIPIEAFPGQPHIDVVMNAAVGEELTVTLGSNQTTGFQWSEDAEISDQSIIKQVSHKFVGPETDVPGTPGQEVWTFEALKEGTVIIFLEYSRPWNPEDIGHWTVTLNTNIKPVAWSFIICSLILVTFAFGFNTI